MPVIELRFKLEKETKGARCAKASGRPGGNVAGLTLQ
jgi:hypothetical protein